MEEKSIEQNKKLTLHYMEIMYKDTPSTRTGSVSSSMVLNTSKRHKKL